MVDKMQTLSEMLAEMKRREPFLRGLTSDQLYEYAKTVNGFDGDVFKRLFKVSFAMNILATRDFNLSLEAALNQVLTSCDKAIAAQEARL